MEADRASLNFHADGRMALSRVKSPRPVTLVTRITVQVDAGHVRTARESCLSLLEVGATTRTWNPGSVEFALTRFAIFCAACRTLLRYRGNRGGRAVSFFGAGESEWPPLDVACRRHLSAWRRRCPVRVRCDRQRGAAARRSNPVRKLAVVLSVRPRNARLGGSRDKGSRGSRSRIAGAVKVERDRPAPAWRAQSKGKFTARAVTANRPVTLRP